MPFREISGKNIRNLKDYQLVLSPAINIVAGKNGSGKTNLLEAIYLNALGRSFRTSATRNIISDTETSCWVFGEHQNTGTFDTANEDSVTDKVGLERRKGNYQKLSINGVHHNSLAELAALVPILALQPTETLLIDGSSSLRRKYLDWLMFHVEPSFLDLWRENQRLLKQRNRLLRSLSQKRQLSDADYSELKAWDTPYIKTTQAINVIRLQASSRLAERINEYLLKIPAFNPPTTTESPKSDVVANDITAGDRDITSADISHVTSAQIKVTIDYYQGWVKDCSLEEALVKSLAQDIKQGFTKTGTHRANLNIHANTMLAKEFLSRGQKKLLSMVMRLAQAAELKRCGKPPPILLLDDLFAELDVENAKAFLSLVEDTGAQVFITCLNTETWVSDLFSRETKVFHVEHGKITI